MKSLTGVVCEQASPVRAGQGIGAERGMVTIELAIGVLIAAFAMAGLVGGITLGLTHAAASASAQQIALHTARGDASAVERARGEVPRGGRVEVEPQTDGVEVTVTVQPRMPVVGEITVSSRSWARWEPGVGP